MSEDLRESKRALLVAGIAHEREDLEIARKQLAGAKGSLAVWLRDARIPCLQELIESLQAQLAALDD